ncbi:MAG: alternative ribosome rescue aminoacyl-tRNA hydrolase ArfB [Desulfobulbaceae bacterium]
MIKINPNCVLPEEELRFTFSRAGGPGGQNVNKVSSRVTLRFDVTGSPSLTEHQKELILRRLRSRMSREGILQVVAARFRTQNANREDAVRRFITLLADALAERTPRKKTRVPQRSREARLRAKKRKSSIKAQRSGRVFEE